MSDLIKREDAIKVTWQEPTYTDPLNVLTEVRDRIEAIPSADRPQGNVDAVDIFEREMHNLEQGYITLGEFDERIEPLRHLCYDRPQGKWIDSQGRPMRLYESYSANCSACGEWSEYLTEYCPHCGARMKGADDE